MGVKIDWKSELTEDMYYRLCECRNLKSDIVPMAKIVKRVNNYDSEQSLDYILEWITDWNNQFNLYPDEKEYNKMLKKID